MSGVLPSEMSASQKHGLHHGPGVSSHNAAEICVSENKFGHIEDIGILCHRVYPVGVSRGCIFR